MLGNIGKNRVPLNVIMRIDINYDTKKYPVLFNSRYYSTLGIKNNPSNNAKWDEYEHNGDKFDKVAQLR